MDQDSRWVDEIRKRLLGGEDIETSLGAQAGLMIVRALVLQRKIHKQGGVALAAAYLCRDEKLYRDIVGSDAIKGLLSEGALKLIDIDSSLVAHIPLNVLAEELVDGNRIGVGSYEGFSHALARLMRHWVLPFEKDRAERLLTCLNNGMIDFQRIREGLATVS